MADNEFSSKFQTYRKALYTHPIDQVKIYHIRQYFDTLVKTSRLDTMFASVYVNRNEYYLHLSDNENILEDLNSHTVFVYQNMLKEIRDLNLKSRERKLDIASSLVLLDLTNMFDRQRKKTIIIHADEVERMLETNKIGFNYIDNSHSLD